MRRLASLCLAYPSGLGQPPFDPRMMTALLLHAYASGIYSSRRIAKAASINRNHEGAFEGH